MSLLKRLLIMALVFGGLSACASRTADPVGAPACGLIEVYVREGCPYCALAKGYLAGLQSRRPDLVVKLYDVRQSEENLAAFRKLSDDYHVEHRGVPTFLICGKLIVGFSESETPPEIEALVGE